MEGSTEDHILQKKKRREFSMITTETRSETAWLPETEDLIH